MGFLFNRPRPASQGVDVIDGIRVTQPVLAQPIPIIMGTQRVPLGLVGYTDFTATAVKQSGSGGGKGLGGGGNTSTTYNYTATVIGGLCQGVVNGIVNVWGSKGTFQQTSISENFTVPTGGGSYQVGNHANFENDLGVGVNTVYGYTVNDYGSGGLSVLSGTHLVPLEPTSGSPAAGQYGVNTSTGTYAFGSALGGQVVTITYTFNLLYIDETELAVVPNSPYQVAVQNNALFQSDISVVYFPSGTALTKVASSPAVGQYSVRAGIYQFNVGDLGNEVLITYQINDTTNQAQGAQTALNFTLFPGTLGQSPWSYMTSAHPGQALGYSQLAYIGAQAMQLGPSGELPDYTFEIIGSNTYGQGIVDCDPADCIESLILDQTFGVGAVGSSPFPVSALGDTSQASDFFVANGFFISPLIQNQRPASSLIHDWLEAGMTAGFWSEGQLKLIPFGDSSIVGNGAVYTPLNTAICPNIIPDSNGTLLTWPTSGLTFSSTAGATQGGGWQYTGTGSASGSQTANSLEIAVVPGASYTLSAYINAAHVTSGAPAILIDALGFGTTYETLTQAAGTNGQISLTFTAPGGVFNVTAVFTTNNCTVASGQTLTFSNPQLQVGGLTGYANSSSATGLQPVVDLDDDDFVVDDNNAGDPVKIAVSSVEEAYNRIQIQYANRLNAYNPEIVYEQNDTFIDRYGVRLESPLNWDFITTNTAATVVANLRLKRSCYINNTFEFRLKSKLAFLECMDLVTITLRDANDDPLPGFDKLPVRIIKTVDDPVKGISVTAEEFPWGTATATLYPKQVNTPYIPQSALADPGPTSVLILEVPDVLSQNEGNQLKMFCAPTNDTDWGGCIVNLSFDNINYSPFARVTSPARIGTLANALPAGVLDPDTDTLTVNMGANGTLQSVSAADFAQAVSLSAVFNPAPTSSTTPVNLSSYFNRFAILPDGMSAPSTEGHDGHGDYFSQTLLGPSTTFNGTPYQLGTFLGPNLIPDSDGTAGSWTLSGSGIAFSSTGGAVSGGIWKYTGTGGASGFQFVNSEAFAVIPGNTYTLSAYVNGMNINSGSAFVEIANVGLTTGYGSITINSSSNGRMSASFTIPSGVTSVVALWNTNNCTVASGQTITISDPQLEPGSHMSAYQTTNQLNAIDCTGQTITLPSGKYNSLWILAAAANMGGTGLLNQTLTVNYTTGVAQTITQSFSDWWQPQNFPGEFAVYTMPYFNVWNGTQNSTSRPAYYIFNYDYSLDTTRTVSSLVLPNNGNLTILAITLSMEAGTTYNFELLSYENATVTGTAGNQYALTPLHRGLKGTSNLAHAVGETFVRLDEASISYTYDPSYVGKTIYVKCCSFNTMGGRQQSLSQAPTESFVLQGFGPGAIDAVTGAFLPGLDQIPNGSYLYARTAAHSSYRPTSNPLTGHDAGSSANINIASFFMRCPGFADISLQSGSITGLSYSTLYYIYYSDLYALGGAVSYQATTTKEVALENTAFWFVGSVLTPAHGAPDTQGNNDGGTGPQSGQNITMQFSTLAVGPGTGLGTDTAGNGSVSNYGVFTNNNGQTSSFTQLSVTGNSANNFAEVTAGNIPGLNSRNSTVTVYIYASVPTNTLSGSGTFWEVGYTFTTNGGVSSSVLLASGGAGSAPGPTIYSGVIANNINLASVQPFVFINSTASQASGSLVVETFGCWAVIST